MQNKRATALLVRSIGTAWVHRILVFAEHNSSCAEHHSSWYIPTHPASWLERGGPWEGRLPDSARMVAPNGLPLQLSIRISCWQAPSWENTLQTLTSRSLKRIPMCQETTHRLIFLKWIQPHAATTTRPGRYPQFSSHQRLYSYSQIFRPCSQVSIPHGVQWWTLSSCTRTFNQCDTSRCQIQRPNVASPLPPSLLAAFLCTTSILSGQLAPPLQACCCSYTDQKKFEVESCIQNNLKSASAWYIKSTLLLPNTSGV